MAEGMYWGQLMATSGGLEVSVEQMKRAYAAGDSSTAYVDGDERHVAEFFEWYRLYEREESGAQAGAVAKNLKRLAQRLDGALDMIYERDKPFPSDAEISGAWEPALKLSSIVSGELQAEHLSFGWRAREAFAPASPSFFEAMRRSIEATTFLREAARLSGGRIARKAKRAGFKARDDLVLRLVAFFEVRTGRRATVTIDNYADTRTQGLRSKAADFVRSVLGDVCRYLTGDLTQEFHSDRNRHLNAIAHFSGRDSLVAVCRDMDRPGRLENLIDRFGRGNTPAGRNADVLRARLKERLGGADL